MCPCKLWSYYILYYYILSCNFLEDTQLCGTFPLLRCHVCTSLSGLCTLTSRLQTIFFCAALFSLLLESPTATLVRDTFSLGVRMHCTQVYVWTGERDALGSRLKQQEALFFLFFLNLNGGS